MRTIQRSRRSALWSGEPDKALEALGPLLDTAPDHWRWRALHADARRDLGDPHAAIADYLRLVSEHAGTGQEAVLVQHLGKAYFAAEDYVSAGNCFERALNLRTAAGADQALVESSRQSAPNARRSSLDATLSSTRSPGRSPRGSRPMKASSTRRFVSVGWDVDFGAVVTAPANNTSSIGSRPANREAHRSASRVVLAGAGRGPTCA